MNRARLPLCFIAIMVACSCKDERSSVSTNNTKGEHVSVVLKDTRFDLIAQFSDARLTYLGKNRFRISVSGNDAAKLRDITKTHMGDKIPIEIPASKLFGVAKIDKECNDGALELEMLMPNSGKPLNAEEQEAVDRLLAPFMEGSQPR